MLKLISFLKLIDLGLKNWKMMWFNFFEPLTQSFGLLMKTTPILCVFDTVNIYKVTLPDRTINLPCILQFRCRFEGVLMITKDLEAFLTRIAY